MRVAALCEGDHLERWHSRCIDHLLSAEGVETVTIIVAEDTGDSVRHSEYPFGLFAGHLRRRQLRGSLELSNVARGVPRIYIGPLRRHADGLRVSDEGLVAIREIRPDVVLALGVEPLFGDILEIPRDGVWAFDFDRNWTERTGLGELGRVLRGEAVADVELLRLPAAATGVVVLRRGFFKADTRSPLAGLARARDESARWPALVCSALGKDESVRLDGPVVEAKPVGHSVPGLASLLLLGMAVLRNRLGFAWGRLLRHNQWNIGIVDQPIHAFLHATSDPPIRWFPLRGRRGFLADPFGLLRNGGDATILCEHYDYRKGKGTICHIEVSDGGFDTAPLTALELAGHMSYPCLVEDGEALYCVPEVQSSREVSLFKADPFPGRWTKVGALVADVAAIDPTVFRHEGRWWLMCIDADGEPDTNLLAWHAPALLGPWTPHAANPVKTDVRSARPAGTPFSHQGRLYRPAQDCSRTYGGRIVINEVTRLTPQEFLEHEVATIEPASDSPYPAGRHTLSAFGESTLIDGHRFVFVGVALLHFLRIWGKDLLGSGRNGTPQ